ncbi:rRNA-processing protein las1 [Orbilia ellipsospora]|uniref:rRNA-processing protein las1 n=1 Tax=Orbilia ellipsospora TaxID=2528407 RepID=A0AAV9X7Z4_9PEZI
MLQTPRVTVWSSIDDLRHLKSLLYENAEYDSRPRALEIIRAWSTRGRLPHAIESTAHLTECVLHDTPRQSELMVRMGYSTAICRFVNGLLDPAQKSHFAVSMYSLAQELQLPASFVDIRHAATHEALPPLGVLRTTCSRAFDWLWVHYWDKIDASGGVVEMGGKLEKRVDQAQISRVQGLLDRWDAINTRSQAQQRQGAKRKDHRDEALLCAELAEIFKESADNSILLEILVHEHLLVMEENSNMLSIYKATESWRLLIEHLGLHVDGFASGLFDTILEAIQEVEDTDTENRDEFAESESEYTYQWLEFLVSLLIKGQLAGNNPTLLDDVVSQCILSRNIWCLRLAEYAIGQSSLLESKYSQACTMAKKQLTVTSKQTTNVASNEEKTPNHVVPVSLDSGTSMDLDQELDDFEAMLKIMQARREQWGTSKRVEESGEGSGKSVEPENSATSNSMANGKRAARFRRAGPEWSPKPMGAA